MESSSEATVLAALERAELAARERRLAASTEAERIATAGREDASVISSHAEIRIAAALDALRKEAESAADRAIETLERAAAGQARARVRPAGDDPVFDEAVELVVASVLGERASPPANKNVS
ncbi:MAG: hypothetical protein U9O18_00960 [Chloroflexota bacterium]|nr:hypothetical protein [Chloroflexota bacterium]